METIVIDDTCYCSAVETKSGYDYLFLVRESNKSVAEVTLKISEKEIRRSIFPPINYLMEPKDLSKVVYEVRAIDNDHKLFFVNKDFLEHQFSLFEEYVVKQSIEVPTVEDCILKNEESMSKGQE